MAAAKEQDVWTKIGTLLLWLAALPWVVYYICLYGLEMEVTAMQFLPLHLAGVIPGALLRRRRWLGRVLGGGRRRGPSE